MDTIRKINDVSEEEIKDILRNRDEMLNNIRARILSLYDEMDHDVILTELALATSRADGMPGAKGNQRDMGDLLETINARKYQRGEEIREMMWEISERESKIDRVWGCYQALSDPYYTVLHDLYIDDQLYDAVERSFGRSHKTFEKIRKEGIRLIRQFYRSGDAPAELWRKYSQTKDKNRREPSENTAGYEQITLGDLADLQHIAGGAADTDPSLE